MCHRIAELQTSAFHHKYSTPESLKLAFVLFGFRMHKRRKQMKNYFKIILPIRAGPV